LIFGLNTRVIWERLGAGETPAEIAVLLPDEFHEFVLRESEDLRQKAFKISHSARLEFVRIMQGGSIARKAFAEISLQSEHQGLLFSLYDGKDIETAIWKSLRPSGEHLVKAA